MKILFLTLIAFTFVKNGYSSVSDIVEISGFVTKISKETITFHNKYGVELEVPRTEVAKAYRTIAGGDFVKVKISKTLIKASKSKSIFSKR
ncbi:MAG: hypothetical protein L6Q37_13825 [Bdellovibrionaceae bacterium]|nr:hypothetical protein [Pseudobdellovibrionaceae bacterium]NUM57379.1 hypothetical protein [Pseudobdellovibrionaceae bacterium]